MWGRCLTPVRGRDVAESLNHWPVFFDYDDPGLATGVIPGTTRKVTLAKPVLPLFLHFLAAWNKEMPARLKLDRGPVDGFEPRQSRQSSGFSNHASGTAVDLRYDVLEADNQRHMTDAELVILKRILARYRTKDGHPVLSNGWSWGNTDEMHTELSQGWDVSAKRYTTLADVQEVTKRLGIKPDGTSTVVSQVVGAITTRPAQPVVQKGAVWCRIWLAQQGITGDTARILHALAGRESGWSPSMVYPPGEHDPAAVRPPSDWGLWQVNSVSLDTVRKLYGPSATMRALLDPKANLRVARELSNGFTDWTPWGIGHVDAKTGQVVFDWRQYPQAWLDRVTASGRTQREESEAGFKAAWGLWGSAGSTPAAPSTPVVSLSGVVRNQWKDVRLVQSGLNRVIGAGLVVDGRWGPATQAAYDKFRRVSLGLSGQAAVGLPGVQSLTALGDRAGFRVAS